MKKLVCSLAIVIGFLACSTRVLAQAAQQYEYAVLATAGGSPRTVYFMKPDGITETIQAEGEFSKYKGGTTALAAINALNEVMNKKAKEGWELASSISEYEIYIRRLIKK